MQTVIRGNASNSPSASGGLPLALRGRCKFRGYGLSASVSARQEGARYPRGLCPAGACAHSPRTRAGVSLAPLERENITAPTTASAQQLYKISVLWRKGARPLVADNCEAIAQNTDFVYLRRTASTTKRKQPPKGAHPERGRKRESARLRGVYWFLLYRFKAHSLCGGFGRGAVPPSPLPKTLFCAPLFCSQGRGLSKPHPPPSLTYVSSVNVATSRT